ncbi:MAG: uncharacterized protein JWM68_3540 [Verrucomicrobiales bacterium]|nr:uncharacterized protein [Verrucomicrobiales bacterium]
MKLFLAFLICSVFGLLFPKASVAHGDVHQQILVLTEKMQASTNRAELLLRRAELYRMDEDYLSALADCSAVARMDPTNSLVHFVRGRILFDKKKFSAAKAELDRFLETYPQHSEALLIRARSWRSLGETTEADKDYTMAINAAAAPEPDWYYEYAQMLQAGGQGTAALAVVDNGCKRTGAVSLELFAVDLAVELKDFDNALHRLDKFCSQSQRKEKWFVRRGEVLEKAGRPAEACESYKQAEQAWVALPRQFQSSVSAQQLHTEIAASLQRLK